MSRGTASARVGLHHTEATTKTLLALAALTLPFTALAQEDAARRGDLCYLASLMMSLGTPSACVRGEGTCDPRDPNQDCDARTTETDSDGLCDAGDADDDCDAIAGEDADGDVCDDLAVLARGGGEACDSIDTDSDGLCDALVSGTGELCDGDDGEVCDKLRAGIGGLCGNYDPPQK